MDGGAQWATVHGVAKSRIRLSDFTKAIHGASPVLSGKESACSAEDEGSISGIGRSSGEANATPLHCSCLGDPMDRGAW